MTDYLKQRRMPRVGSGCRFPGARNPNQGRQTPCCSQENVAMQRFDLSPLFRSTVGFDRLARLADAATRVDDAASSYPPYNIEKTGEDAYRISMAVGRVRPEHLGRPPQGNAVVVAGQ